MKAMLVGMKKFHSTKSDKDFTTAYLVYDERETVGQACNATLLNGHDYSEDLVGQQVNVETDLRGRVLGITAA